MIKKSLVEPLAQWSLASELLTSTWWYRTNRRRRTQGLSVASHYWAEPAQISSQAIGKTALLSWQTRTMTGPRNCLTFTSAHNKPPTETAASTWPVLTKKKSMMRPATALITHPGWEEPSSAQVGLVMWKSMTFKVITRQVRVPREWELSILNTTQPKNRQFSAQTKTSFTQ